MEIDLDSNLDLVNTMSFFLVGWVWSEEELINIGMKVSCLELENKLGYMCSFMFVFCFSYFLY